MSEPLHTSFAEILDNSPEYERLTAPEHAANGGAFHANQELASPAWFPPFDEPGREVDVEPWT